MAVPPPPLAAPPLAASQLVASTEPVSTAPVGAPSGFPGGSYCPPLSDHPFPHCIYHPAACPKLGRLGVGGRKDTNTLLTRSIPLLPGGEPAKNKKTPLSSNGGQCGSVRNILRSLRPLGLVQKRTSLPLTKNMLTSPRSCSCTPSHPSNTCTVSPVKVAATGAPPTKAAPAYHHHCVVARSQQKKNKIPRK